MKRPGATKRFKGLCGAVLSAVLMTVALPVLPAAHAAGNQAVTFNGSNQYATLGASGQLNASQFTIETWFKRTGTGTATSTGGGGITISPLITKGRAENENPSIDVNYALGIDAADHLVADYEDSATSANHPTPDGSTTISNNVWYHAAATWDGTALRVYLNGNLETSTNVNISPASATTSVTAIGSALTSPSGGSVADGFFQGQMDEVHIWNVARSQAQIAAGMNSELNGPVAGLMGSWHMNEGSGTVLNDSSTNNVAGALVPTGSWGAGAPALGGAPPSSNYALQFNGSNQYVTFGAAPGLGASSFTLETWFQKTGTGAPLPSTGTGGLVNVLPLIAKGRNQADGSNVDMNYFLGIDSSGHLAADFEDKNSTNGTTGDLSGQNHPSTDPNATIANNVWYHVAVTYDTTNGLWKFYVNGNLDFTSGVQSAVASGSPIALPQNNSIQHASIASALDSTGAASGYFQGIMDEARIWTTVRSQAQIQAAMNTEIGVTAGLVGLYHLNEGTGTTAGNSAGVAITGNFGGTPTWVAGAPALGTGGSNQAPDVPVVVSPNDGATGVSTSPNLDVTVNDADGNPMNVTFYGRPVTAAVPGDFTIGTLPDTQFYSENGVTGDPGAFTSYLAQTQFYVDSRAQLNTQFVVHLGDITQNFENPTYQAEWTRASQAQATMDNAGLPNSVVPGNHDVVTATGEASFYDQYFPPSRYQGNAWYGGYQGYGPDGIDDHSVDRLNKDNYELFDVGSLKFLFISLEVDMPLYSTQWAQNVIDAYPDRRVMIVTHAWLDPNSGNRGTAKVTGRPDFQLPDTVFNSLIKTNCNIFMVINGHYTGENTKTDLNNCGQPVHQVVVDYQGRANGGDGWLRYMTFRPSLNEIDSFSYNANSHAYETDANSQFTLPYNMGSNPVQTLGTVSNVASGAHAVLPWNSLASGTQYEWYAVASDGITSTQGPTSVFTTTGTANQPPVMDSVTINQASPHTNDTLTSTVAGHDPEGASVTYSYQWLRNGSAIVGANAATLNLAGANNGNKGDQISLRVRASDGTLQSAPMTSSSVTVLNTAPTATVSLNTTTPQDNTTLTATATKADVDGDTVTLTYTWRVNGVVKKTTPNSSSLNDTFDLSVAGNGDTGDQITVTVTPFDGTASGPDAVSLTATVGATNQPPVANDVNVLIERQVAGPITLSATDPNGDPVTYTVLSNPAHGVLSGTAPNLTYTPTGKYVGADSFTYRGNDNIGGGNIATVHITVAKSFPLSITNAGFSKTNQGVQIGSIVRWTNNGSVAHRVADNSGLNLYDSGSIAVSGVYGRAFIGAGKWAYRDPTTGATATIKIPPEVSQGSGGTSTIFTITWAGMSAPAGMAWDIQIKRGSAAWANWVTGTTALNGGYTADAGTGAYKFRARMRRTSDNVALGWSSAKTIQVV